MIYPLNFEGDDLEQAYMAGYNARLDGNLRNSNPYDSNRFQIWNAWNDGFDRAGIEVEERRESFLFQEEQPEEVEDAAD